MFVITNENGGYSIKTSNGKYIGNSADSNKITLSDTPLVNNISLKNENEIDIISSGGAYLRFNTSSGQDRFRYFKSTTYTAQKAITLYKLVEESSN